jgi:hypothetical protein
MKMKEERKQIIAVGEKEKAECFDVTIVRANGQKMAIKVVLRATADDTLFFCITDKPMAPLSQKEKIEIENAILWKDHRSSFKIKGMIAGLPPHIRDYGRDVRG